MDACVSRTGLVKAKGTSCQSEPVSASGSDAIWLALGALDEKRQMRRSRLAFQPERTLVLHSAVEEDAALPDALRGRLRRWRRTLLRAILEIDVRNLDFAAVRERFPICLEIFAFESGAANLFGKQPVLHGMIDVLEKLPVDPLIDGSRDPDRCRPAVRRSSARSPRAQSAEYQTGSQRPTREKEAVVAIEFLRKFRLFIYDIVRTQISIYTNCC